jgi:hypothetical protein
MIGSSTSTMGVARSEQIDASALDAVASDLREEELQTWSADASWRLTAPVLRE